MLLHNVPLAIIEGIGESRQPIGSRGVQFCYGSTTLRLMMNFPSAPHVAVARSLGHIFRRVFDNFGLAEKYERLSS